MLVYTLKITYSVDDPASDEFDAAARKLIRKRFRETVIDTATITGDDGSFFNMLTGAYAKEAPEHHASAYDEEAQPDESQTLPAEPRTPKEAEDVRGVETAHEALPTNKEF